MGVIKFGIKDAVGAEAAGGNFYEGEVPPAGVYHGIIKRLELTNSAKGDPMLKCLIEVSDKDAKKKKYNGYGIWTNLMVTDQGKGYVNLMLNSIAGSLEKGMKLQKLFWLKGVSTVGDGEGHILKIGGTFKVNSPNAEIPVIVGTKRGSYKGEERLEVSRFLVPSAEANTDAEDEAEDEDDVIDADVVDEADLEDEAEEADDDDEEAADDDDDEPADDDAEEEADEDSADEDADDLDDEDGEDENDVLRNELLALELKPLRIRARDDYNIYAGDSKGKTQSQIIDMIFDSLEDTADDDVEDDDDLDEPAATVTAIRRTKGKKAPF